MFRTIPRATLAPLAVAFVLCSTDLHAAWNWTFPFYHGEQAVPTPHRSEPAEPAPPAQPAAPPVTQPSPVTSPPEAAPVSTPAPVVISTPPVPEPVIPPPPVSSQPPEPETPTVPESSAPGGTAPEKPTPVAAAPVTDTRHIDATVLREDNQWQGNLQIDGWITVAPQATLTVSPGTIVQMGKGSGIHIQGRIVMRGTIENPILFTTPQGTPSPGEWQGIVLSGSEKKNSLDNVRIEGAETALLARFSSFTARGVTISRAHTGMQLQECVLTLAGGRITDATSAIVADNSELTLDGVVLEHNRNGIGLDASSLMATELTLKDNRSSGLTAVGSHLMLDRFAVSGSETGARITRGEGAITASDFRDNGEAGLVLANSRLKLTANRFSGNRIGLQIDDHQPVLWGNALFDNKSYNLLYLGEESSYAGGNWFGSGSREESEKTVFSKRHDALQIDPLLKTNPLSGN